MKCAIVAPRPSTPRRNPRRIAPSAHKGAVRRNYLIYLLNNGAQGRDRTTDTAIFSRMLYQLSYLGAGPGALPEREERRFIVSGGGDVQPDGGMAA